MNQMPHQADKQTVATANPVHAENLPITAAAAHTVMPQVFVQQGTPAEKPVQAAKPATAGKAPGPNAAAAIQIEQEAAAGQARQSADKILRKKRLGESEGDQNAESSVDSSYDVVAANTTETAAPAEEATAAGGSSAAASGSSAWLPIAGGGLGLAAIGGGGGGAAAVTAPTVSTFAVSIAAVAGPVTAALNYKIYDAQGNLVASGVTDATGKVTVNLSTTYSGQPLLITISDANGAAADFRDEATNASASLGSTALRASFVATGGSQSVTVSPITELAVQKMGITTDAATASAATVNATNASVGAALGVSDILGAVTTVLSADYNEANGVSAAEAYGQALAKLSGLDQANGSMSATFTALLNALNISDATLRASTLITLLNEGAVQFEAGPNSGAATLPVLPTLTVTDSVASGPTNAAVTYTFTFSEAVTGFDANDITVTNGTKGTFTPVSATEYRLVVTPTANAQGADLGVSVNAGIGYQGTLEPHGVGTLQGTHALRVVPWISRVWPRLAVV
ncbi:Ig-like domain-containing protein [Polaromonas sp. YR568]|uniref:Ig-like domain-containing protein n=1 Tax=Polaromonas sp. YR568 TaxID=1855301 RepID=UPI00398BC75E